MDLCPGDGAGEQAARKAEDMEQGQDLTVPVPGGKMGVFRGGGGGVEHIVGRQQHPLGLAGGARAEDDHRGVVGLHLILELAHEGTVLPVPLGKVHIAAHLVHPADAGVRTGQLVGKCVPLAHRGHVAHAEMGDVPDLGQLDDLFGLQVVVNEQGQSPQLLDGEEGHNPVGGVCPAQGHMASLAHP